MYDEGFFFSINFLITIYFLQNVPLNIVSLKEHDWVTASCKTSNTSIWTTEQNLFTLKIWFTASFTTHGFQFSSVV